MVRIAVACLVAATLTATGAASARADRRAFTHTYEYVTAPAGQVDLEFWNEQSRASFDDDSARGYRGAIEVEYGITNHWDIALYMVFGQASDPADPAAALPLTYTQTKIETRYRLGERGQSAVDTVLYFEIAKPFGVDGWEFEPKLILARDFGKTTVAFNAIAELEVEKEIGADGESEVEVKFEPGWALGASYELKPAIKLGAEVFGALESPGDENELEAWAGPCASWAPSDRVWTAATAAFGLTDDSDKFRFQFIIGLSL